MSLQILVLFTSIIQQMYNEVSEVIFNDCFCLFTIH